jgi:hypothetical protein
MTAKSLAKIVKNKKDPHTVKKYQINAASQKRTTTSQQRHHHQYQFHGYVFIFEIFKEETVQQLKYG